MAGISPSSNKAALERRPVEDDHADSDSSSGSDNDRAGTGSAPKKVSCQPCREAKVKCIPSATGASCTRCVKLDRECVYRTHKRGRKPGKIKLQQILRRLELLDRTLDELRTLNKHVADPDASSLIETLTWQLHRSKFFTKGAVADAKSIKAIKRDEGTPPSLASPQPLPTAGAAWERERASLSRGRGEMQRSRSDFNMLVDMEDQASVSRVPDEFPTLSNPLKLLAQASSDESARRRKGSVGRSGLHRQASLGAEHAPSSDEADGTARARSQPQAEFHTDEESHEGPRKRRRSQSPPSSSADDAPHTGAVERSTAARRGDEGASASSWASTYFSRGAFHPVYDNRQEFDPIDQGLLTVAQAERLITSFYATFGTFMHIFDPELSSITYIRKHSAFLLTVICALSAEFEPSTSSPAVQEESAVLAVGLRRHYEAMITWITAGDYKNVEMAQAFFLLASYRPMSESAMSDQTWLFLGTAIRIATELGCNLVCYSYSTPAVHANQHYQRQLRNTERLWINLWNLEKTLASQTGQRMHLADEGVIATCSRWHSMPLALRQDEALVAQIELRRIMIAQGDHFNTHVLRSLGARRRVGEPTTRDRGEEDALGVAERDQLTLQLSYFRNSVHMDLKRWEERWLSTTSTSPPTPLQITGPLSLDYAALVTYALALPISYSVDVTAELAQLYRHCYISCTNYMATFIDRSQRGYMDHVTNSFIVSTVYAVVFALDLSRRHAVQKRRGQKAGEVDLGFVSRSRVLNLARLTASELDKIGSARTARSGKSIASKYSVFLRGVLSRFDPEPQSTCTDAARDDQGAALRGLGNPSTTREDRTDRAPESSRHLRRDHNHPMPPMAPGTKASHIYSSNIHFSPHLAASWPAVNPAPSWTDHSPGTTSTASTAPQGAGLSPASWFNVNIPHPATGALDPPPALDPQWEWMMKDLDFFAVDGGGGGGEPILDQMGRLFG